MNPHYKPCPEAGLTCFVGLTSGGLWLARLVRLILSAGENGRFSDQLGYYPETTALHPHLSDIPDLPRTRSGNVVLPNEELAELAEGLTKRPMSPLGFDTIDMWNACKTIRKAAGVSDSWGLCPVCFGSAMDPEALEAYSLWEASPPPGGDGYQIWENSAGGAPVSPVFASENELREWLKVQRGCSDRDINKIVAAASAPAVVPIHR